MARLEPHGMLRLRAQVVALPRRRLEDLMLRIYLSPRGHPLVYRGTPGGRFVLTVENTPKWYGLVLVSPSGDVEPIDFPDFAPEGERAYVDHVPNPRSVQRFARANGLAIDGQALEMIIGRWQLEALDNYADPDGADVI